jgi:DNA repair protein RecN (Recombination protein N)
MLTHLTIRDLAVIEEASLEFGAGLNVLTGETGAGKSVIVDALELLRGVPRSRARVREGASSASVEAQFLPGPDAVAALVPLLEKYDLPWQDELVLARRIDVSGRTRSYVQGRLVPRQVLTEIGEQLIEICGQHESHALRSPGAQLAALDRFAGMTGAVDEFAVLYGALRSARARLEVLVQRRAELQARRELVEFQLGELAQCPRIDYLDSRQRVELARSVAELEGLAGEVAQLLTEGEDAVAARVAWLSKRAGLLLGGVDHAGDHELGRLQESLSALLDGVHDAVRAAAALAQRASLEPGELEQLEHQLAEIERLARKHRARPEELSQLEERLRGELDQTAHLEQEERGLRAEVEALHMRAEQSAARLHEARQSAARALERAVAEELGALCLAGASVELAVEPAPLSATGATQVTLRFSGSPGLPPAPLGRVASGGELSRVLLALKVASRHGTGTAVFDEIDAGAGGLVAERIGERLRHAALHAQVLCVTHWPQVAAHADAHLRVHKASVRAAGGVVARSSVERVEGERRVEELSRMLGGSGRSARGHAQHLLEVAQRSATASSGRAA